MKTKIESSYRYTVLCIADQYFGVEVKTVQEVLTMPKFTIVPNVQKSIVGVFNLRGQIYSIIDFRVILNLELNKITQKNLVVLLENANINFGIVVDRVIDVVSIDSSKIQIPTRDISPRYLHFISGYYEQSNLGLIYLVDVPSLIKADEIIQYRY